MYGGSNIQKLLKIYFYKSSQLFNSIFFAIFIDVDILILGKKKIWTKSNPLHLIPPFGAFLPKKEKAADPIG